MPAVLTHQAIMLLARRRIADIRDRLQEKVDGGGPVTDLEHRVLYLAKNAHRMMSLGENAEPSVEYPGDEVVYGGVPLGGGVSPFAVMGSMGPDLTGFSALFQPPRPSWVFDVVHKGTPDGQRERVVAGTTDLPLELWRQVRDGIASRQGSSDTEKSEDRAKMRAYVLGHLCHVAGDVLSHPFIADVEWHLGVRTDGGQRARLGHQRAELFLDAEVARAVFLREGVREGQEWTAWWPSEGDVPDEFFQAYAAALDEVYEARGPRRPRGFGEFEREWQGRLPELTAGYVQDGWSMLRGGVLPMGYSWGWWSWWGYLTPAVIPVALSFPLIAALPRGKQFVDVGPWSADERAWFEALMLPLTLGAVTSGFYGIWLATISTYGVEVDVVLGIVSAALTLLLGIIFFATLGLQDDGFGPGIRWLLLWLPGVAFALYHLIRAIIEFDEGNWGKGALYSFYSVPLGLMALVLFLLGVFGGGITHALQALGADEEGSAIGIYATFTAIVTLGALVAWFVLPSVLRDAGVPEDPDPFPARQPHFARLFDDGTLFHPADVATPTLADLEYPADRRKLLKLWWSGPGSLHVRARRTHLEFSLDGAGEPDQVVPGPLTPMTPREYGAFLEATVQGEGGATDLHAEPVYDDEPEGPLPPGAAFADQGDGADTVLEHAEQAGRWVQLKASADEADYFLRHAPRPAQAIRFGRQGSVPFDPREPGTVAGPGTVESDGRDLVGDGTDFTAFFDPGDRIQAGDQVRIVTRTESATRLRLSSEFNPPLPAGTGYARVGIEGQEQDGYRYVTDARTAPLGGQAIMDYAADLGALLCLGATPHLLDDGQLAVDTLSGKTTGGAAVDASVSKVHQVFRNWNLDRRRENEWRALVAGGAFGEKGGNAKAYDPAMPDPPDGWTEPSDPVSAGEAWTRRLGWVPLLRSWVTLATARQGDGSWNNVADTAAVADGPTHQELSRAMAFLLDLPDARVLD